MHNDKTFLRMVLVMFNRVRLVLIYEQTKYRDEKGEQSVMYQENIVIQNKTGLHARPASMLLELAQQFESEVMLYTGEEEINAKSIISILAGGVLSGSEVRLEVEGPDEVHAGKAVAELLNSLPD